MTNISPLIEAASLTPEGKAAVLAAVLKSIALSQQPVDLNEIVASVSNSLPLSESEIVSHTIDAIGLLVFRGLAETDGHLPVTEGRAFHFGGKFRPSSRVSELIWYDPRDARDDDHGAAC
jgi:hypothetical protein